VQVNKNIESLSIPAPSDGGISRKMLNLSSSDSAAVKEIAKSFAKGFHMGEAFSEDAILGIAISTREEMTAFTEGVAI